MSWLAFVQIALLIVIYAFATTVVRCLHDTYCKKCKQP